MRFKSVGIGLVAGLVIGVLTGSVSAQPRVSVAVGPVISQGGADCVPACDRQSGGWRATVGYERAVSPRWHAGVEIGYIDFGHTSDGPAVQRNTRSTAGPLLGFTLAHPLTPRWTARGRLGIGALQTRLVTTVNGFDALTDRQRHAGLLLGAGVAWRLGERWSIEGAIDVGRHRFSGLDSAYPWLFSIGAAASF
jgi:opacity protein-like surface antigen